MKVFRFMQLIGAVFIGLPWHIAQGNLDNVILTIGIVTFDIQTDMCNFSRFHDLVEDIDFPGDDEDHDESPGRMLSEDDDRAGDSSIHVVHEQASGDRVAPQQAEIETFITSMEKACMEMYDTHLSQIIELDEKVDRAEDAYKSVVIDLENEFKTELGRLIMKCEARKEKFADSASQKQGREKDFQDSEMSDLLDQCDNEYRSVYDRQEMEIEAAQTHYENTLQAILVESKALIDEFNVKQNCCGEWKYYHHNLKKSASKEKAVEL